jgi:hypothetical protein
MKPERLFRKFLYSLLLGALVATVFSHAGAGDAPYRLLLQDPETDAELLRLPLNADETFTIRYIHSVDHTPVFEIFEIAPDGRLALNGTYFQMFGAGMGHWEGRGTLDFDGRWTWIRDIHETLDAFILRVGAPTVDHTILYRDQEIHLSQRWAGKRVRVTVAPASSDIQPSGGSRGSTF